MASSAQLAELRRQFESCSGDAQELTASVSKAELMQPSAKGGWSIAECVEHLTATNRLYLSIMEATLPEAPAGEGPYKMDFRGRMLKWMIEPPYRMGVKTMPGLEPKIQDAAQVLPDFLASQQQFFAALEPWNGRALDKVMVASPFDKKLRYNVYSMFNIIAAHQRRHLWQAHRIKDQIRGK